MCSILYFNYLETENKFKNFSVKCGEKAKRLTSHTLLVISYSK